MLADYVRINTTNPTGNELQTALYLKRILDREGIPSQILDTAELKPSGRANVYARLKGNGSKKAIALVHHMDVVPADARTMFIYRMSHYAQPTSHMARYSLRTDGFISVNAPYRGGELLTKPLTFSGSKLEINFVTSAAGGIRVEIQDGDGKAIPGYALADCPEIIGDKIDHTVSWSAGTDIARLAGKPVRLRFSMKDADLYSLRFF